MPDILVHTSPTMYYSSNSNLKVDNISAWKKRNNLELREEDGTTQAPLFVILAGVF